MKDTEQELAGLPDDALVGDENEAVAVPVVAVVGRPNVGKSTLVNRIIGRRQAVVEDVPGVTRDRVAYDANWIGREFTVVDTGGWEPDAKDRAAAIARQAEAAITTADVVLFVVDAMVGATDDDEKAVKMLRRSKKPVLLVANKVDNQARELETHALWSLGLGQPYPISALHGRGSGELLDAVLAAFPTGAPLIRENRERGPRRVALVGRPNVGKSSLLNRLAKEERSVVDPVAGTTVDPVDSLVTVGGEIWQFVDTAGLRKRAGQASGTEYYASLRTSAAIEASEVTVVLFDSSEVISEQDQRLLSMVSEAGRGVVLAFNKWDLVDDDRRHYLDKEIDRELKRIPWALRVNISALTGRAVDKLAPALRTALRSWEKRIATGRLNQWLTALTQATPHPVRGGRAPRIMFATQPGSCPPKFVLFTTGQLDAGYVRFIERKLREEFGFEGSPIEIAVKPRKQLGPGAGARRTANVITVIQRWANAPPAVAAVEVALPSHVHSQDEIVSELARLGGPVFERFARSAGVQTRRLAIPIADYEQLSGFTAANEAYRAAALELGEQAVTGALKKAGLQPEEVDLIISTTVTGLSVPSLEARLANRIGLRPDVKRLPLFGLGCVAGAAGVARMHDYLRAFPDHVAVLVAVELCSLTIQRGDTSPANLVASSLFGDGAAAVVAAGGNIADQGPRVLASRSHLYPDTEGVMGWDIGTDGFRIVLSTEVAPIAEKYMEQGVSSFLAEHDLSTHDIAAWICHPGGPKVIETIQRVLGLPPHALTHTRNSLRDKGNLSSVSVLDVLGETMAQPPPAGSYGLMIAMGPGFCSEFVLLRW